MTPLSAYLLGLLTPLAVSTAIVALLLVVSRVHTGRWTVEDHELDRTEGMF